MKTNPVSKRFSTIVVLIAAVLALVAIGALQSIAPSPTAAAEQRSAFVQSGGVATDADPDLPGATRALGHARGPVTPEVSASTF